MRVAHINVTSELSTGRIALGICESLQRSGHAALLCHARGGAPGTVPSYRIGNRWDTLVHAGLARLFDCAGFLSRHATKKLVRQLMAYKPDLVHLHNLHGYYLNLPMLMGYLAEAGVPVVWTLHDCWPFTGHCAHYAMAGCERFRSGCHDCPNKKQYPASYLLDRSKQNWLDKRDAIRAIDNLTLVTPSQWMAGEAGRSYLAKYPICVIPSGIDLDAFYPATEDAVQSAIDWHGLRRHGNKPVVLSVASAWRAAKGINDLMDLQAILGDEMVIAVAGLTEDQMYYLPPEMIPLPMVRGEQGLRALYTAADIYISLSYEESQGLTLVEALACGTQVVCYDQTALPEIITEDTGIAVPTGDLEAVADACRKLLKEPKSPDACRNRACAFDRDTQFAKYVKLYEELVEYETPAERPREPK
ncbi:MAG TPA: glycosyltransferase [Candidatus Limiplasma sp.]|nr:glycosyltransferase [Candidatus Limiplasma sp.]